MGIYLGVDTRTTAGGTVRVIKKGRFLSIQHHR